MKKIGIAVLALAVACSADVPETPIDTSAPPAPAVAAQPGTFTVDDFRRLHWMAGRWRGSAPEGTSFYEEYSVPNDSTIEQMSYKDSTFSAVTERSRIELRGGRVTNEGATARWVASRLDSTGVDFAPDKGARNAFTWTREGNDRWTATLRWNSDKGPQTVVYRMQRIAPNR